MFDLADIEEIYVPWEYELWLVKLCINIFFSIGHFQTNLMRICLLSHVLYQQSLLSRLISMIVWLSATATTIILRLNLDALGHGFIKLNSFTFEKFL